MAFVDDPHFWPKLGALRECLCAAITDRGLPEPCFCGIIPGNAVPFDYAGNCSGGRSGMAWVRLASIVPMPVFIEGASGFTPCGVPNIATVEVGIVRPYPVNPRGEPPTVEQQDASARLALADMAASQYAVTCCGFASARDVNVVTWTPIGPDGGVIGGYWLAEVLDE